MATYGGSDIDAMLRSMQNMMRLEQTVGQVQARGEYTRERESLQQELDRLEEQEKEAAKGYGTAERKGQKKSSEKFLKNLVAIAGTVALAAGAPYLAPIFGASPATIATLTKISKGIQTAAKWGKGIPAVAGATLAATGGVPGLMKGSTQAGAETFERETRGIPTEFEYQPPQEKMTFLKPQQREAQVKAEEAGEVYGEEGTMREMMAEAWEPMGELRGGLDLPSPTGLQQMGSVLGPYLMLLGIFGDKSKAADIVLQQGTGGPLALPGEVGSVINPFKAA